MRTHVNKYDINFGRTHGINLRNTCEGHMGTVGIRYGTFGKEYEVKKKNKLAINWEHIGDTLGTP